MVAYFIFLMALVLLLVFSLYLWYRNEKTYQFYASVYYNEGQEEFEKLPPYFTVVFKFWVWPLDKFRRK